MPDDEDDILDNPPQPGSAALEQPPAPPAQAPAAPQRSERVHTLRQSAFKTLKEEQRARGKKAALSAIEQEARALGFTSYQAMKDAAVAITQRQHAAASQASAPQQQGQAAPAAQGAAPADARRSRHDAERARLTRVAVAERRQRIELARRLREQEAETELRMLAMQCGVKDVDYAIVLLRRHINGYTKAQLAEFDEKKFFSETLRQSNAYLYDTVEVPVSTSVKDEEGVGGGGSPAAQPKQGVTKFDARTASGEEYTKQLAKRGLTHPSLGMFSSNN